MAVFILAIIFRLIEIVLKIGLFYYLIYGIINGLPVNNLILATLLLILNEIINVKNSSQFLVISQKAAEEKNG